MKLVLQYPSPWHDKHRRALQRLILNSQIRLQELTWFDFIYLNTSQVGFVSTYSSALFFFNRGLTLSPVNNDFQKHWTVVEPSASTFRRHSFRCTSEYVANHCYLIKDINLLFRIGISNDDVRIVNMPDCVWRRMASRIWRNGSVYQFPYCLSTLNYREVLPIRHIAFDRAQT